MSEHIELFKNVDVSYDYHAKTITITDSDGKGLAGIRVRHWDWEGDEKDFICDNPHIKKTE